MLSNFKKPEGEGAMTPPAPPAAQPIAQTAAHRQPVSAARPGDRVGPSVIGSDLSIVGNLTSKGQVQIDGQVQGDINASHVIIGERASITGGIRAQEVVVRGQVMGSIHGKRVMLQAQSHVEGDIYHQALAIEQGAFFEGKSRRAQDPLNEAGANASSPNHPASAPATAPQAQAAPAPSAHATPAAPGAPAATPDQVPFPPTNG